MTQVKLIEYVLHMILVPFDVDKSQFYAIDDVSDICDLRYLWNGLVVERLAPIESLGGENETFRRDLTYPVQTLLMHTGVIDCYVERASYSPPSSPARRLEALLPLCTYLSLHERECVPARAPLPQPLRTLAPFAPPYSSQSSYSVREPEIAASSLPAEPTAWTYDQLLAWLTQVAYAVWERVKGALAVSPELDHDLDAEHEHEHKEFTDEEDIGVGERAKEGDVFEEWDSVGVGLDEQHNAHRWPSSSVGPASTPTHYSPTLYEGTDAFGGWDYNYEDEPDAGMSLSIENIMAAPTTPGGDVTAASSPSHSPLSSPSVPAVLSHRHSPLAMSGISEDAEDEDAAPKNEPAPGNGEAEGYTTARPGPSAKFNSPPNGGTIQGLKISTSPAVSRESGPPACTYRIRRRTSSPGCPRSPAASASARGRAREERAEQQLREHALAGSTRSTTGSIGAYDPVGERGPGNPLFPSNFARLAVGPTLRANNPALRSPRSPPQPAYPFMRHLGMSAHGRGAPRRLGSETVAWELPQLELLHATTQ
ncbi:hypothetical protein FIBSPDRAFT_931921 [Athelia psychrophila]|uniref:Uncharacterized protein n=1 Tax=Athelia psychrophila TaxID=1759441 RepID=A0A166JQG9_9AGAM|nr:hypothetical protein FIBSPDRAFT_931921 [Fibularhizoctonia sp. CBS 109695]